MCISGRHRSRFVQIGIYFGVGGRSAYPTFSRALCMIPLIVANKDKNILMFFLQSALFWSVMFDSGVALRATDHHRHALVLSRDYHNSVDTRDSVPTFLPIHSSGPDNPTVTVTASSRRHKCWVEPTGKTRLLTATLVTQQCDDAVEIPHQPQPWSISMPQSQATSPIPSLTLETVC